MDEERLDRLIARLWGKVPDAVYAIVDGARDPHLRPMITSSGLPHACLFTGTLAPELAAAAPHLVELGRRSSFTRDLLRLGWGKSFGIFLAAPASLETLRRHFRRFLRVADERGQTLYFRYYDPRVLRPYLPTCDAGELATVFGPVTRYMVEDADPSQILEYRRAGPQLSTSVLAWDTAASQEPS